jgi:hypothetical protein
VEPEEIEGELLILTGKWKTPEERAAIYAAIADMPTKTYLKSIDRWKVVGYARKALEHTSDLVKRCHLYSAWGGVLSAPIFDWQVPKAGLAEARRRAVVPYLNVLAIVAENLKITEHQPPPSAGVLESKPSRTSPRFHEWAEWANKRVAAVTEEWRLQEDLLTYKGVMWNVVELYSHEPYATEELRRLATEIVKKPEMVNEIMAAVEAKMREQDAARAAEEARKRAAEAEAQPAPAPH